MASERCRNTLARCRSARDNFARIARFQGERVRGRPGFVEQRLFRIDRDTGAERYLLRFRIAVALMNGVNGNYVNAREKEERLVASSNQETGNLFRYSWPSRKAIEV